MSENHWKLREAILKVCQRLHQRNMLAACDGNVSVRLDEKRILMTPSARAKAFIEPEEIAILGLDGAIISGNPSGERLMHLAIYRNCPRAKAVVHAHPPHAMAWTIAQPELTELPSTSLPEVILAAGRIPIVPYARPSTEEMGTHLLPYLPKHRALILSRHGAVVWGESLEEAVNGMERVEHTSQILFLAKSLGGLNPMEETELKALREMRDKMGDIIL